MLSAENYGNSKLILVQSQFAGGSLAHNLLFKYPKTKTLKVISISPVGTNVYICWNCNIKK